MTMAKLQALFCVNGAHSWTREVFGAGRPPKNCPEHGTQKAPDERQGGFRPTDMPDPQGEGMPQDGSQGEQNGKGSEGSQGGQEGSQGEQNGKGSEGSQGGQEGSQGESEGSGEGSKEGEGSEGSESDTESASNAEGEGEGEAEAEMPMPTPSEAQEMEPEQRPKGAKLPPVKITGHRSMPLLTVVAMSRGAAMLVGPAGSGKTTATRVLAEYLELPFSTQSCSEMMMPHDLLGFMSAAGTYVAGILRDAFENGGIVLLDEMDAANPSLLVSINAIAAAEIGDTISFPDGKLVPRHPDFVLVAGCNTWGNGQDDRYVGRQVLDAATLDRFVGIPWDYDESLELAAALSLVPDTHTYRRTVGDAPAWVEYVQKARRTVGEMPGVDLLITPRSSILGARLLREGMALSDVAQGCLWRGADRDMRSSVESAMARA